MDLLLQRFNFCFVLLITAGSLGATTSNAQKSVVQFDMPSVAVAVDKSVPGEAVPGEAREVTIDLALSSLIAGASEGNETGTPPIDHLLVRCRLRDRHPVVDYAPKTELQSDFAGPISVTEKDEQIDSFGLNVDAAVHALGAGRLGADDTHKQSDSTEFQRQAPLQAVIASGTFDRGRGVYFKLRWTTQQVLEGEKHFRVSFAVPAVWRGGLLDVSVVARGIDRSLFGTSKMRELAEADFVIATYQQEDTEAARIALRLAQLDQKLAAYAKEHPGSTAGGFTEFWRRLLKPDDVRPADDWYRGITNNRMDPYHDRRIQTLPMPVRVAVLGYTDAARELMELDAS